VSLSPELARSSAIAAETNHVTILEPLIRVNGVAGAVKGRCEEELPDNSQTSCCAELRGCIGASTLLNGGEGDGDQPVGKQIRSKDIVARIADGEAARGTVRVVRRPRPRLPGSLWAMKRSKTFSFVEARAVISLA
jgi:hypothetical protein